MFSTLRTRFGIPGVISVIALVFAMLGGAYAAQSDNGGKATASAKAKRGPRGPKGATGPVGSQGPAGPAGAKGDAGANGSSGATGPTGPIGPVGKTGPTGPEGSPWTAGGTLPPGKTETGAWNLSFRLDPFVAPAVFTTISFPIPLAEAGEKAFVFNQEETENKEFGASGCEGTLAKPTAPQGTLCVYTYQEITFDGSVFGSLEASAVPEFATGYGVSGARLWGLIAEEEGAVGERLGTWAVTAP